MTSDDFAALQYLIRCDEAAVRTAAQLREWLEEANHVFLGIAHGMPHLWREMDEGRRVLGEVHARISDEAAHRGADSPRRRIVQTFQRLIEAHRQDQEDLAAFTTLFDVVHQARTALDSLGDLMDDVACFSVNAIVQAHNAGDRGRGFARVSREVVALTERAGVEFERVRAQARRIEEGLSALHEAVAAAHGRFEASPIRAQEDVEGRFAELDAARAKVVGQVDALTRDLAQSAQRVSHMLVGLQLDDRASRTSERVAAALNALHEQVAGLSGTDPAAPSEDDAERLLDAVTCAPALLGRVGDLVEGMEGELERIREDTSVFLDDLARELHTKADAAVEAEGLTEVMGRTRESLEAFVAYMRELVEGKADIVSRAEALAGLIIDLRDDLEGVRRTAKRFGVMASIIKVELASAGLSEALGEALSADRVETLYRDMAAAVGSVLIALESAVKQVQRRCGAFRQGLVRQEDTLRQAEGDTARLVNALDGTLVQYLARGGTVFRDTLLKLHRESARMGMEVGNIQGLGRQSGHIKADARARRRHLEEVRDHLLARRGLADWALRPAGVRALLEDAGAPGPAAVAALQGAGDGS